MNTNIVKKYWYDSKITIVPKNGYHIVSAEMIDNSGHRAIAKANIDGLRKLGGKIDYTVSEFYLNGTHLELSPSEMKDIRDDIYEELRGCV